MYIADYDDDNDDNYREPLKKKQKIDDRIHDIFTKYKLLLQEHDKLKKENKNLIEKLKQDEIIIKQLELKLLYIYIFMFYHIIWIFTGHQTINIKIH